jgi:acyl carrier protein
MWQNATASPEAEVGVFSRLAGCLGNRFCIVERDRIAMEDLDIVAAVNEVFAESFEIPSEKLVPQAHIFNDLGIDSLDVVDLVVALQKKFNVRVQNDQRVRSVRTLQDIYEYITALKKEQAGRSRPE